MLGEQLHGPTPLPAALTIALPLGRTLRVAVLGSTFLQQSDSEAQKVKRRLKQHADSSTRTRAL